MFINLTKHNSADWGETQMEAAEKYGGVIDYPFPEIDPNLNEAQVQELAAETAEKIASLKPQAVLCQGEMSFGFRVTELLKEKGITVLCATSERVTEVSTDSEGRTIKKSSFEFIRFRRF